MNHKERLKEKEPPVDPNVYYFVNNTTINDGTLALKRVKLDGSGRETIMVLNGPVPGTRFRASRLYPLSTIRSDGKKLAISCFLGDGQSRQPPWGLLVFDIEGKLLISDNGDSTENEGLFLASLGQPGTDRPSRWQYLLNPRSSMKKEAHIHPFLSPDGSIAFFNSDETGGVQAYAITGLPNIPNAAGS